MLIELACRPLNPPAPSPKKYLLNGCQLDLAQSQQVNNLSREFNHGYIGSGPAQLALAICLELFSPKAARIMAPAFEETHIATLGKAAGNEAQYEAFTVLLDVTEFAALARLIDEDA